MKKAAKISLVIATILCVVGLLTVAVAFAAGGADLGSFFNTETETSTHEITLPFTSVNIDVDTADILFVVSPDNSCKVVCKETKKIKHTVAVKNETLDIRTQDTRKWYEYIGIFTAKMQVTVYLPEDNYGSLQIDVDTGDVTMPQGLTFQRVNIESDTGDISWRASVPETLEIGTDTGNITIEGLVSEQLSLETDTGNVALRSSTVSGQIKVETDTGHLLMSAVECNKIDLESSTGDVLLENVLANESIRIQTSTGDVELDACDAASLSIRTSTGDVNGTLLTKKIFDADSSTGKIRLPDERGGGRCEVRTSTGDIEFSIIP